MTRDIGHKRMAGCNAFTRFGDLKTQKESRKEKQFLQRNIFETTQLLYPIRESTIVIHKGTSICSDPAL